MRTSTAVFVGIGTVVVAIGVGLSGGLITNVMSPRPLKQGVETARLERRAPPEQMPASDAVPYVGAALAFVDPSIGGAAAHHQRAAAGNPAPRAVQVAEATTSGDQAAKPADTPASTSETEGLQQGATDGAASAPENAYANARAADPRRGAERRRAERVHRWVYRHRRGWDQYRYTYDQQPRNDGDWYSGRRYRQNYYVQQPRYDNPQFRSFGPD
jgi:hypothetical protein